MRLFTLGACLFTLLFLAVHSAQAQDCKQVIEVTSPSGSAKSVAGVSGVVLYAQARINGPWMGQVEVYEPSPVSGVFELQRILQAHPVRAGESSFGADVDTDGETIVVGSDRMSFPGESYAVYIFEKNHGLQTWEQVGKIVLPGTPTAPSYRLGSVAVSGDHIAVGCPYVGSGEVHLIKKSQTSGLWSFDQTIQPPNSSTPPEFGIGLDMDGGILAIGAQGGSADSGITHVYELSSSTGDWNHVQDLHLTPLRLGAKFGAVVVVEGHRIFVGAPEFKASPGLGVYEGAALLWDRGAAGSQWQMVMAYSGIFSPSDQYAGCGLALDGDDAYVAFQPTSSLPGAYHFVYDPVTSSWAYGSRITAAPGPGATLTFDFIPGGIASFDGQLVAAAVSNVGPGTYENRLVIVGDADQDCDRNGVADRCEISNGSGVDANGNGILDVCEGIGAAYCPPPALNSAGLQGELSVDGSLFAGENNLTLRTTQLPPGQFGFVLNSPYQGVVANPGGSQGSLCIFGPSLGRHNRAGEVRYSGAAGEFDVIVDLTWFPSPMGPIMVQAGETWNFQVWYRDQNPGSTSNMTNAVSLTFQ